MSLRILIADDSATNRLLFSMTVTRIGHAADVAASGAEAIEFFRQHKYDLVFLDLNMPLLDGFKTAERLQEINKFHTPLYAISGTMPFGGNARLAAAGIRRCFIKPLDREKINAAVLESHLRNDSPAASTPPPLVPPRLMGTYAKELRMRGHACIIHCQNGDLAALQREAHTLRALAQMLKTPEVETAANALENFGVEPTPGLHSYVDCVALVDAVCTRTANLIESRLASAG